MTIAIRPVQWAALPLLHETPALDDDDAACLGELRAVLARHGRLSRFAIHLAHRHVALAPDEILIEREAPDGRGQLVTVGRREDAPDARPTTWLFDPDAEGAGQGTPLRLSDAVYCVCVSDPVHQAGCVRHGSTASPSPVGQRQDELSRQREAEDKARLQKGFPVAGHGEGQDDPDKGRGR